MVIPDVDLFLIINEKEGHGKVLITYQDKRSEPVA